MPKIDGNSKELSRTRYDDSFFNFVCALCCQYDIYVSFHYHLLISTFSVLKIISYFNILGLEFETEANVFFFNIF